ncbi:MAG: DUF2946 family protein [Sphingomonas sp.]
MTRGSVALAVLLLALGVRLAVPSGFMPMRQNGTTVLTLCSGHGPMMLDQHQHHDATGQADQPCAFASLSLAATGGAAPILLADAIAYIEAAAPMAIAVLPVRLAARLRPPLRAPPA